MVNQFFEVQVLYHSELAAYWQGYIFDTEDDLYEFLNSDKLKSNFVKSYEIYQFLLVYNHNNPLPEPDGYNEFFGENTYNENYKQEIVRTAKRKDYRDKFHNKYNNYCIKYKCLDKREDFIDTEYPISYHKELNCAYTSKDKKEIMDALYSHSKSNMIFDIKLYEFGKYKLQEECK